MIVAVLKEMLQLENTPKIKCFTDNKSLYEIVKTTNSTKDMRLRVEIARFWTLVVNMRSKPMLHPDFSKWDSFFFFFPIDMSIVFSGECGFILTGELSGESTGLPLTFYDESSAPLIFLVTGASSDLLLFLFETHQIFLSAGGTG